MKIPNVIVGAAITLMLGAQFWIFRDVHDLDIKVARIDQELHDKLSARSSPAVSDDEGLAQSGQVAHGAQLLVQTPK